MTILPLDPRQRRPGFPFQDDFFTLGAPVGPDQPNRREDVIRVETILGNTGHHDLSRTDGPVGYWGQRQEKAVKDWQSQNGLKVDGLLKPGGPTITSLKQAAGGLLGGFTPPSPDEVDQHQSQRMQGEPGILNTRPARLSFPKPAQPLELDEQSQAFNADSARALTRSSVNGDIPRIYGDFAKQAGADAHATLMDLAEQMEAQVGRDRTDQVMHGIVNQLPPDQAKALLGGTMPAARPLGVRSADLPDDSAVPLFRMAAAAPVAGGGKDVLSAAENSDAAAIVAPPSPAAPEEKPVQVAAAPAAIPLAWWLLGGGAAAGGAIAQQQIEKELKKPKGLPTTTIDPQAGKPQVLHGPDPSKPPPQTATPPSTPTPQPPPLPPSTAQQPSKDGNSYPGQPAEPVKPMGPLEIRARPPVDLGKGGKPYPDTDEAIAGIPDKKAQEAIRGVMLGSGVTNGADKKGTHIVVEGGNYDNVKQDAQKLQGLLGIDPRSAKPIDGNGGTVSATKDGSIVVIERPSSGRDEPTLEVHTKDAAGNIHKMKRRYGRRLNE
ncbi:MAG: peptidoglycan-binding protein [Magnetospirillum sp.]|nr:peptidoglycan-binding protein [Magnetospirillum sp.]